MKKGPLIILGMNEKATEVWLCSHYQRLRQVLSVRLNGCSAIPRSWSLCISMTSGREVPSMCSSMEGTA